ncbi:glycine betaine ABC transporter substrate-binding protein [Variovorax terrae]|uniref:Glycine betaine ABC transporter substrate-binding protein n=1 Tax=Variovorax terrae TaxID=2923278 RepID=A0A9X1VY68_9BURK|nr:glycine betaine ABC transporter substrate-binding protein [Variovorax terrae]MCJ0765105.1 glycine betaine ABC transporter substrate-binding protein [Variovorax terrae]
MTRELVIGQIALSFHVASAAVVRAIVERSGVKTFTREAPHEAMYAMLARGEVDMVVSAWLPGSHGVYVDPLEPELLKLGVLYEPYAIWGVPGYVPRELVAQVADLAKPEVAARMDKRIQGIGPGAGISRFSREIMERYSLSELGYQFHNGTLADCTGAFERAWQDGRWAVVPLWHPQYLHHRYAIRELAEPLGLLRGRDAATLVMRRDAAHLIPEATLQQLRHLHLGNAAVAALDHQISVAGHSPQEAAAHWLARTTQGLATY